MKDTTNGWEERPLQTGTDWSEALRDATLSILACGAQGALSGLALGASVGALCGLPFWLLGVIPGAIIGAGVGVAYGFISGLLLGMFLGRWGGLIAGALPALLIVLLSPSAYLLLILAVIGGGIGYVVGRQLEPDQEAALSFPWLRTVLWNNAHWTIPLLLRLLVGIVILAAVVGGFAIPTWIHS